jgi:cystathionine beta-lyase
MYGETAGCFIRLNVACPRKLLLEGLERIIRTLCGLISGTRTCPSGPAGS